MSVWSRKMCGFLDIMFDKGFEVGEVVEMAEFVGFGGWFCVLDLNDRRVVIWVMGGWLFIRCAYMYIRKLYKCDGEILSLCVGELAYGPTRNTNVCSSLNHPPHTLMR